MCAFESNLGAVAGRTDSNEITGFSFDARDLGVGHNLNALVPERALEEVADVLIFAMGEPGVALDDGHAAAEATHGLGEFKTDVTTAGRRCPGMRSNSSASMCVRGFASRRPGMFSMAARLPVLMTTFFPRSTRLPPSARATSMVL